MLVRKGKSGTKDPDIEWMPAEGGRKYKKEIVVKLAEAVMIALTVLSFLKGIRVSLDIDESYAVALGYRMAAGDRLFRDMWEPHQLSGFLAALFTAPYVRIRGNTDYLVIYLRTVGTIIHTIFGLLLYRQLAKSRNRFPAFCIMVLHLNFLPKWIQTPEFELIHYWCLLGIFLALYAYFTGEKPRRYLLFLGGCFLVCSMLCYPTMILLYPFYLLAICVLERQYFKSGKRRLWGSSVFFTLGAFLPGAAFLIYLFSYMSFSELKRYISFIFLDASHDDYTSGGKWADYLDQIKEQMISYGGFLLMAAVIVLAVCLIYRGVFRRQAFGKNSTGGRKKMFSATDLWPFVTAVLLMAGLLMQTEAIRGFLLGDENQFYLQGRYIALLLPAVILGIRHYREMALWLYLSVIPGLVSVAAVLFVTNMGTNVTYAKAFFGVLGSLMILDQYGRTFIESSFWKKIFPVLQYVTGGLLLAGLLVCRLILIRVSGCLPVTVRAPLEKMESGPEKGIYVLADTAGIWNDNYRILNEYTGREDKVLYIGSENLIYVELEALPATPSTHSTAVYNEMFLYYYEEHPDRIPNVIVYDKTFEVNPAYALTYTLSMRNPVLFQWIEENYSNCRKIETDHMIILRR